VKKYRLLLVITIIVINGSSGICSGLPNTITVAPNSITELHWLYSTSVLAYGWHPPDYMVNNWYRGVAPFGSATFANALNETEWKGSSLWLREEFDFSQPGEACDSREIDMLMNFKY
jgi:hypothetical protein